ncbi:hypothetical protein P376_0210 [Streptomyces sp. HCCB10043]|nr:hypothetical protein P376_0210 [Streptomyces sp. HCCB10043]
MGKSLGEEAGDQTVVEFEHRHQVAEGIPVPARRGISVRLRRRGNGGGLRRASRGPPGWRKISQQGSYGSDSCRLLVAALAPCTAASTGAGDGYVSLVVIGPLLGVLVGKPILREKRLRLGQGVGAADLVGAVVEADTYDVDQPAGDLVGTGETEEAEDLPGDSLGDGGRGALRLTGTHLDKAAFRRPLAEQPTGLRGASVVLARLCSDLLRLPLCDPRVDEDNVDRAAAQLVEHAQDVRSHRRLGQAALVKAANVHRRQPHPRSGLFVHIPLARYVLDRCTDGLPERAHQGGGGLCQGQRGNLKDGELPYDAYIRPQGIVRLPMSCPSGAGGLPGRRGSRRFSPSRGTSATALRPRTVRPVLPCTVAG